MKETECQNKLSECNKEILQLKKEMKAISEVVLGQQKDINGFVEVFKSLRELMTASENVRRVNNRFSILMIHILPSLMMGGGSYFCITYKGEYGGIVSMAFLLVCSIFSLMSFLHYYNWGEKPDRGSFIRKKED